MSYTIEIETNKMNLKKNEYSQKSKQSEIDKLQSATQNTEVRSEIDGVIQKIDTSKMTSDDGDSVDDSSAMDNSMSSGDGSSDSSAFITILLQIYGLIFQQMQFYRKFHNHTASGNSEQFLFRHDTKL